MEDKASGILKIVSCALLLTVGPWLLNTPAAFADDKAQAMRLIGQGDKYIEKAEKRRDSGREARATHYFEKALAAYQKAYELFPSPQIYYAIANAEAGLKRFKEAMVHYQKVIDEVDKPALIEAAKARIEELAPEFAVVTFNIAPAGAELSINAELRGVAPLEKPLMLTPGKHTCTIAADGYDPQEVVLELQAGTRTEKDIELEKSAVLVKRPVDDGEDDDKPDFAMPESKLIKKPSLVVPILGTSGTVIFLGASVGLLVGGGFEGATLYSGIGAGVAGLGLGAFTAYHFFKKYRPQKRKWKKQMAQVEPKFWLTPLVQAKGGGLAVGGRF